MLSFECIKNEKSVYFLLTSAKQQSVKLEWTIILNTASEFSNKFAKTSKSREKRTITVCQSSQLSNRQ